MNSVKERERQGGGGGGGGNRYRQSIIYRDIER